MEIDGFTNLKDGSHPGQPKTVATKANIAAVAGLIKLDTGPTEKILLIVFAYQPGSAHKMLTRQLSAQCAPSLDLRTIRFTRMRMPIF